MRHEDITTIIQELLENLSVTYEDIEVSETVPHTFYTIKTPDSGVLIGTRGETLTALRHMVKLLASRRLGEDIPQFSVDVNYYQQKKINELKRTVSQQAERVKFFQRDVELSPMSSYERLIIHTLLKDEPRISTQSSGEGKFRRITLKYTPEEGAGSDAAPDETSWRDI